MFTHQQLIDYITSMRDNWSILRELGQADLHSFVLQHGRPWTAAKRPKGMRKQAMKQCFANSQKHLCNHAIWGGESLTYVEGFAAHGIDKDFFFPVHHGWLVDEAGTVIDLTFKTPQTSVYFGVPFRTQYVLGQIAQHKWYSTLLMHLHNHCALLTGEHRAEDAVLPWKELVVA